MVVVVSGIKGRVANMSFDDVWGLITTLLSKPVEFSSPGGRSRFKAWVEGDVVFVRVESTGNVRVITRRVLERSWGIAVEKARMGEDPFQPAWYFRTTNGTYIAKIFKYVVEGA